MPRSLQQQAPFYGLRFGAIKGLVSLLSRLFFTKHVSRRESAALLPSNGTRNVAPSPLTSRTFAVRILSLRARFVRAMVTPFVLGVLALQGTTFMDMLQHGARITAEGLKAEYCKV